MRYIRDTTGRFQQRPYYEQTELDQACEEILTAFMRQRYGDLVFPIPTDALTKLIEQDAATLDLYADLSREGPDVQGITDFYPGHPPTVRIAKELSAHPWREHRLRTTLTHEYGHVKFHNQLWAVDSPAAPQSPAVARTASRRCKSTDIQRAPTRDWMEWQAGYVCGALLMPHSHLQRLVADYGHQHGLAGPLQVDSPHTSALKHLMVERFQVSLEAAYIRLLKLGYFAAVSALAPEC